MPEKGSLRERKKLATRTALIATAQRLFAEKGYAHTTLEEICDEVQVHVTTFFSYFESKEELAFARMIDTLEAFKVAVRNRPADVDVITCWWRFVDNVGMQNRGEDIDIVVQTEDVAALRGRHAHLVRQYIDEIANALSLEAGKRPEDDLYAHLYASTLMWTLFAGTRWYDVRYGDETEAIDMSQFPRLILSRFPARTEIDGELRRLRRSAAAREARAARKRAASIPRPS
jgi:AcrR family transcriptional regulator